MSDIFVDLARRYAIKEVTCVNDVVHHIRDGLVAAAGNPITYKVTVGGEEIWVLPPEAGLTFLVDVAVPYVEAVFFRGMPFLGTVSYNAQARQISRTSAISSTAPSTPTRFPAWGPAFLRACACRTCIAICRTSSAAGTTPTDGADRCACADLRQFPEVDVLRHQRRHRRHHAASIGYRRF